MGYRTATGAQRYNTRMEKIWDKAKALNPELFGLPPKRLVMPEIQIERNEYGKWEVYIDGSPKGEFDTKAEAEKFAEARLREGK